jgi:hypothetical protein
MFHRNLILYYNPYVNWLENTPEVKRTYKLSMEKGRVQVQTVDSIGATMLRIVAPQSEC